jgi:hypothetical protein
MGRSADAQVGVFVTVERGVDRSSDTTEVSTADASTRLPSVISAFDTRPLIGEHLGVAQVQRAASYCACAARASASSCFSSMPFIIFALGDGFIGQQFFGADQFQTGQIRLGAGQLAAASARLASA